MMGVQVSSSIQLNQSAIRQLDNSTKRALVQTADALLSDVRSRGVMPFDTGTLQNDSTFLQEQVSEVCVAIISSTPYARRLYFHPEYNFSKAENSNAGGEWFKDYLAGGSRRDFVEETFETFCHRLMGV